jgi:hypothetical protein
MDQTEARKTTILVLVGLALLLILLVIPSLILGNAKTVSLPAGSPFGGQISQYMGMPDDQHNLAVEGKDFAIDNTLYFSGNAWALVHFKALTSRAGDGGYAIFHKQKGMYAMALSPSSAFMSTYLQGMPDDLVAYLHNQGVVYEPSL